MAALLPKKIGQHFAPPRFILFSLVLIAVTTFGVMRLGWVHGAMTGFDAASTTFLVSLSPLLREQTPDAMRRHANENDANRAILLAITGILTTVILAAVFAEMNKQGAPNVALVITTLALAWLFANTIFSLHYAHIYYLEGSEGGLDFAGDPDCPDYWDFVYFAFTLGMTFQTSDTEVATREMRKIVTLHSLLAFVFNIGILAFSINTLGGKS